MLILCVLCAITPLTFSSKIKGNLNIIAGNEFFHKYIYVCSFLIRWAYSLSCQNIKCLLNTCHSHISELSGEEPLEPGARPRPEVC